MFDFLKKKISNVVSSVTKMVTKEDKSKPKKEKKETEVKEKKTTVKEVAERIFKKVTERQITEDDVNNIFNQVEMNLLEADVAVSVIDKFKEDLKNNLLGKDTKRTQVKEVIENSFRNSLLEILTTPEIDLEKIIQKKRSEDKPTLFIFLGFNGSGKTTSLAKFAKWLIDKKYSVVFAAGDSFRAASIEQLEEHANKLRVKVIKHQYGADPAAVVFDAVKHAESHNINVVLADTAGRTHVNKNLMDQLEKVCRVNKSDLKILVLDSLTGNDIINQCEMYDKAVGVDALILTKVDVVERGGSILSAAYVLKKPILFLGIGQEYENFEKYNPDKIAENLL
ncbi:MAG: signal recognition particle-docking protein FtsY [Candidatus Aenigmarchaeota archaeon]|nr:signal recognition particle-docking protein FtsY [Candidatus Aenigmarchaeota archaeon]